jgi:hypothetical protein
MCKTADERFPDRHKGTIHLRLKDRISYEVQGLGGRGGVSI